MRSVVNLEHRAQPLPGIPQRQLGRRRVLGQVGQVDVFHISEAGWDRVVSKNVVPVKRRECQSHRNFINLDRCLRNLAENQQF